MEARLSSIKDLKPNKGRATWELKILEKPVSSLELPA